MSAKDVSYRNKAVVHVGKDLREFGCTEKQAHGLLWNIAKYLQR